MKKKTVGLLLGTSILVIIIFTLPIMAQNQVTTSKDLLKTDKIIN